MRPFQYLMLGLGLTGIGLGLPQQGVWDFFSTLFLFFGGYFLGTALWTHLRLRRERGRNQWDQEP